MRIGYTPKQEKLLRELSLYLTIFITPERRETLSSIQGEMRTGRPSLR